MNHYRNNLEILTRRFPGVAARLEEGSGGSETKQEREVITGRDGHTTLRYGGQWIHSRHAPLREAERLIEGCLSPDCPYALFYGFGLAYHIEIFMNRHPGVPFSVVEPDTALFRLSLELRDYREIFKNPSFSFALAADPEAMPALLENTRGQGIEICMLRPAVNSNRDYFDRVEKVVRDFLARREINAHTLDKFSRLWVSNICRNLPLSISCPGVSALKDSFTGRRALLLAAGPTLSGILSHLGALRQRMLIVCVDTALKACLRVGIEPDFLILTDPQYWNSRHLDRCRISRTIMISDVSTYPSALRISMGKTFFCSTPFPLGQFYESRTEVKGKLKSGGSVATAAWDFIRQCGVRNIVCSGLDLSFPGGETHYRGSTFEERLHSLSSRTASIETSSWLALQGGNPYRGECDDGRPVLSDQRMKIYIHWFEEQMGIHREVETLRLSSEGIKIKGMGRTGLEPLYDLPECRVEIDREIDRIMKIQSTTTDKELRSAHRELLSELDELISLSAQAEALSIRLMNCRDETESENHLSELNRIDSAILNRESREMAGFILAPVLEEHMARQAGSRDEILENSRSLYSSLKENLLFHKDKISTVSL